RLPAQEPRCPLPQVAVVERDRPAALLGGELARAGEERHRLAVDVLAPPREERDDDVAPEGGDERVDGVPRLPLLGRRLGPPLLDDGHVVVPLGEHTYEQSGARAIGGTQLSEQGRAQLTNRT